MEKILSYTLFEIDGTSLKVFSILKFLIFVISLFVIFRVIKTLIFNIKKIDQSKKYVIYSLAKYIVWVLSIVVGLDILGFNLSVLVAGSAALLVGIGLGLQNLFADFISGIIILVDSTIKVDDIIDVNGLVCKVQEINLRTTTVLTRDDKYIILPNSQLTHNQIINWTHSDITSRFDIKVGVDYSSDVNLVMKILKDSAIKQDGVKEKPTPFVRFVDYADSSLNFEVYFWSDEVFRAENIKSEIRVRIFNEFKQNNIVIPFPQRVVHLDK